MKISLKRKNEKLSVIISSAIAISSIICFGYAVGGELGIVVAGFTALVMLPFILFGLSLGE